ncbi:unnamed protein product [Ectocarpus sp. 12 AP-2014]
MSRLSLWHLLLSSQGKQLVWDYRFVATPGNSSRRNVARAEKYGHLVEPGGQCRSGGGANVPCKGDKASATQQSTADMASGPTTVSTVSVQRRCSRAGRPGKGRVNEIQETCSSCHLFVDKSLTSQRGGGRAGWNHLLGRQEEIFKWCTQAEFCVDTNKDTTEK